MDELKTKIDLVPLSDETIKHSSYLPNDLWMVQTPKGEALGPFHTKSLKEYAHKYQYLFEKAQVYNLDSDKWQDMFAVSKFQRRRPQLVSAHNLMDNQQFFIIFQGQKNGPHSQEKIQQLLDDNQITTSTQLSLDKGRSWIKLYEHHAFDRRSKKHPDNLPTKPLDNAIMEVLERKDIILEGNQITDDMLVELSLMKKRSKKKEALLKKKTEKAKTKVNSSAQMGQIASQRNIWKYAASSGVVMLLAVVVFNFTENSNMSKFRSEVTTEIKGINNSERSITKRLPASVKPTRKIKPKARKPVVPRYRATTRRPSSKRPIKKPQAYAETFEQDIENIDINDPDFQDELTRQLANEEEGEYFDDESMNEPFNEDAVEILPSDGEFAEDQQQFADEADYGEENGEFDEQERIEHEVE